MIRTPFQRLWLAFSVTCTCVALLACSASAPAAIQPVPSATVAQNASAEAPAVQSIAMADAPQTITPQQYQEQFAASGAPYQLIDVRTAAEYADGHIAGAVDIPVEELSGRLAEVSKDHPVVLYCRSGRRATEAAGILENAGYKGIYNLGGIQAWQAAGLPLEK